MTWAGDSSLPFGGFHQIRMQAALLDHGFAVIAPAADGAAWATNFPNYEGSTDHVFIPALLDALEAGEFGTLDMQRLYATGISSGGYMSSRMAVTYPGRFAALAIQSGSYATCSNVLCAIPADLPDDHPPTLFLHGQNDVAVPIATMRAYDAALKAQGTETKVVIDPAVVHAWLKVAPEEITQWFMDH
jgi:poly(3-hydroxybutyrate) depolymerase